MASGQSQEKLMAKTWLPCDVCNGDGTVPKVIGKGKNAVTVDVMCKACRGRGGETIITPD